MIYLTLTLQTLSVDMVVLGCVKAIHEYEVIMGLPNNLTGTVSIANISDGYKALLQKLAHGDEDPTVTEVYMYQ